VDSLSHRGGEVSVTRTPDPQPTDALAEAAAWRLIGLLFERPRPGWHEEIEALAVEVHDPDLQAAAEGARETSEGAYLKLLGPGGALSPREVAYRDRADPGHILADIASFYEAFAFTPQVEDPIDHIAVEASFVGYLHLKKAYALASGDEDAASLTDQAMHQFFSDHLGTFVEPLARGLEKAGPAYLIQAARALQKRV
jgi:TorA maturation chaperone TorD